jgi:hypothetical protein
LRRGGCNLVVDQEGAAIPDEKQHVSAGTFKDVQLVGEPSGRDPGIEPRRELLGPVEIDYAGLGRRPRINDRSPVAGRLRLRIPGAARISKARLVRAQLARTAVQLRLTDGRPFVQDLISAVELAQIPDRRAIATTTHAGRRPDISLAAACASASVIAR